MTESMPVVHCLIVDDEPNAIRILEEYCGRFGHLRVTRTASNAFEALTILQKKEIGLLFLDIQMPAVSGIQLLGALKNRPAVIITTAHREYAADAFDFEVIDFLLKPISFERFAKAVNRHLDNLIRINLSANQAQTTPAILSVRCNRKEIKVPQPEILYLQACGDYVILFLTSGEKLMTIETLTDIGQRLPPNEFARIHRSFIINRRQIRAIGRDYIEIGRIRLPLSRNYRPFK